ncbi:amidase [Nocardia vinacea]|uniref:amidase n=1 Tax=Nocardia vinacea TaxID=96468 RepID=UPI00146A3A01|nr:amidase family protein [Nocardia vinacea]
MSAVEVVERYIERIEAINPRINAIVSFVPERALREAQLCDARLSKGELIGPLHGVPMAFKDNHDVAGLPTTYGSRLYRGNIARSDSFCVDSLRKAGVVTLGKTNIPEFGAGGHTYNDLFGLTSNPWDTGRSAGGSTGGGAAAVSAGISALADGSDVAGSLRVPAAFCGVLGLRPSVDAGCFSPSTPSVFPLRVVGPIGRCVADLALAMTVMSRSDLRAPMSSDRLSRELSRQEVALRSDVSRLNIAYSEDVGGLMEVDEEARFAVKYAAAAFSSLGCEVAEACPDFSGAGEAFRTLRAWDFEVRLGKIVRSNPGQVRQVIVDEVAVGAALTGSDIARAIESQSATYHRTRIFFEKYDLLILPVSPVGPFDNSREVPLSPSGHEYVTYIDWLEACFVITVAGNPALSMPVGVCSNGLVRSVQLVGQHRDELGLLRAAQAFEEMVFPAGRLELKPDIDLD